MCVSTFQSRDVLNVCVCVSVERGVLYMCVCVSVGRGVINMYVCVSVERGVMNVFVFQSRERPNPADRHDVRHGGGKTRVTRRRHLPGVRPLLRGQPTEESLREEYVSHPSVSTVSPTMHN